MMTMPATSTPGEPTILRTEVLLVVMLVALGVAARLLPHALNFSPIVASALFAGAILRHRLLAWLVPLGAMVIGDLAIGFDDWRMTAVVYAAMALPVAAGMLARRYRLSRVVVPAVLSCSLIFFATTNLAVWAFSGMYSHDWAGLAACYVAALPFLKHSIAGDLFWTAALFGGAWLVQRRIAITRTIPTPTIRRN
jgi:hypothetical protein